MAADRDYLGVSLFDTSSSDFFESLAVSGTVFRCVTRHQCALHQRCYRVFLVVVDPQLCVLQVPTRRRVRNCMGEEQIEHEGVAAGHNDKTDRGRQEAHVVDKGDVG